MNENTATYRAETEAIIARHDAAFRAVVDEAHTNALLEETARSLPTAITAITMGTRNGRTIYSQRKQYEIEGPIEPWGDRQQSRIFMRVWVPELNRFDLHPEVVVTDSIRDRDTDHADALVEDAARSLPIGTPVRVANRGNIDGTVAGIPFASFDFGVLVRIRFGAGRYGFNTVDQIEIVPTD